jgi:hypothetical protein
MDDNAYENRLKLATLKVPKDQPFDFERAKTRLITAILRGAFSGLCLRGGLHLVTSLIALLKTSRHRRTAGQSVSDKVKDTTRYVSFLATLAASYVAVDEGLAAWLGKEKTARWRAFAAGAAAGPSLLLTGYYVKLVDMSSTCCN